jgi:hypothetical protein
MPRARPLSNAAKTPLKCKSSGAPGRIRTCLRYRHSQRRKDLNKDCSVLTVTRPSRTAVIPTRPRRGTVAKADRCRIDSTKGNEDARTVTVPPHIRAEIAGHLERHVAKTDEALLFMPVRGGCHVHDRVFNDTSSVLPSQ